MTIKFAAKTDPGKRRDNNEDSYLTLPEQGLFMVADGMGGHNAGEVASRLVVETLTDEASKLPALQERLPWWRRFFLKPKSTFNPVEWLHASLAIANQKIWQASQDRPDQKGMGTTVALILKRDQALLTAHVGDSRVYRLRKGQLNQLTQDHSLAQELVRQGVMSEEEALYSAPSNVLTRALGVRDQVAEDIIYHSVEPNDYFIICSDGLYNMVDDDDILKIVEGGGSIAEKTSRLVQQANKAGGTDNITVVITQFD